MDFNLIYGIDEVQNLSSVYTYRIVPRKSDIINLNQSKFNFQKVVVIKTGFHEFLIIQQPQELWLLRYLDNTKTVRLWIISLACANGVVFY